MPPVVPSSKVMKIAFPNSADLASLASVGEAGTFVQFAPPSIERTMWLSVYGTTRMTSDEAKTPAMPSGER